MAHALLDTTVLIDVLRGRSESARRLLSMRATGDVPCTSAINVEEIVRGLRPAESQAARGLLAGLHVVAISMDEARQAGEWRRDFAGAGVTLSQADCLVAAAALTIGGWLCTGNPKDFPMTPLRVDHWPAGR